MAETFQPIPQAAQPRIGYINVYRMTGDNNLHCTIVMFDEAEAKANAERKVDFHSQFRGMLRVEIPPDM